MRQACHLKLLFSLVCFSSQVLSAESFIWSGGALDDDWSAASNWEGGVAPAQSGANSEGDLIFPSGPSDLNPFNDLPPPSISTPSFIADSVTMETIIKSSAMVSNWALRQLSPISFPSRETRLLFSMTQSIKGRISLLMSLPIRH